MTNSKKLKILFYVQIFLISIPKGSPDLSQEIKQSLVSPCCWAGTIYDLDHNPEMEEQIEKFVSQGKTKDEILGYYVGLYGERILAIPIAEGFNLMAWGAPVIAGIIGIVIFIVYIRTPKEIETGVIYKSSKIPFDDQIESELSKMD